MRIQIWIFGFKASVLYLESETNGFIYNRQIAFIFRFLKKKQIVTSQVLTGVIRKNSAKQ